MQKRDRFSLSGPLCSFAIWGISRLKLCRTRGPAIVPSYPNDTLPDYTAGNKPVKEKRIVDMQTCRLCFVFMRINNYLCSVLNLLSLSFRAYPHLFAVARHSKYASHVQLIRPQFVRFRCPGDITRYPLTTGVWRVVAMLHLSDSVRYIR